MTEDKKNDLVVVVGTTPRGEGGEGQWGARKRLANAIGEMGFEVEECSIPWPRDNWVYLPSERRYLTKKECGNWSEGGFFRFGDNYFLVSETINEHTSPDRKVILEDARKYHPAKRCHISPIGYNPIRLRKTICQECTAQKEKWVDHIDLTSLVVPSRKLLIVDKNFHKGLHHHEIRFREIAEAEGLNLEFYQPEPDVSFYLSPLNCLVLPYKGDEIIFANKAAPSLLPLLNKYDLKVVEVDFDSVPRHADGSINCCTNIKDKTRSIESLRAF